MSYDPVSRLPLYVQVEDTLAERNAAERYREPSLFIMLEQLR
jgi:hypothetical protein